MARCGCQCCVCDTISDHRLTPDDTAPLNCTGPLTPSDKGAYSSGLELSADKKTFTATYEFADAAVAQDVPNIVATGGGERLLSWMVRSAACLQLRRMVLITPHHNTSWNPRAQQAPE